MSQEWYIEHNGKKFGPVSSGKLKKLAATSKIGRETRASCGREGKWIPASKVKGLFGSEKPRSAEPVAPHQRNPASDASAVATQTPLAETGDIERAAVSRLTRFRGLFLDVVLLSLAASAISVLIFFGWGSVANSDVPIIINITLVLSTVLNFVYYLVFESVFQRTVGKMIVGTQVVDREMRKPSFGKILLRTVCRYIPFEPVSFLFGKLGWHDSLSSTVVVRREKN